MSGKTYDVIVVGGGFAGCALAYYLSKTGVGTLLLEAGSLGGGTSAACAGRAQIIESETEEYLDLVLAGFSRLAGLGEELGIDLEWELPGHLTLLSREEQVVQYELLTRRLNRHGIAAEMLDVKALREAEPNLRLEGCGCLGAAYSHEGHLNPFKLTLGYARAALRLGTTLRTHTPVTGFERVANRLTAVRAGAERYSGSIVMLATGAWSGEMARLAGCALPMSFTHAEAIVTEPLQRFIHHHIGMSGFYEAVHGQERTVTLGLGQHPNGTLLISNAIQQAGVIDMASTLWGMPAIAREMSKFFPRLRNARIIRTWAAPSPFLPDYQPAIGWMPGLDNLYVAAGFHLAIPTIPLLAEAVASSLLRVDDAGQNSLLRPFLPERFQKENEKGNYIYDPNHA